MTASTRATLITGGATGVGAAAAQGGPCRSGHRIGSVRECRRVAEAVPFLASPATGFTTGATFVVDGAISSVATVINLT